jgi:hypothetical protein
MVKSEVISFDINKMPISKENIDKIKGSIENIKSKLATDKKNSIKDQEIVELNSSLRKRALKVSDLF